MRRSRSPPAVAISAALLLLLASSTTLAWQSSSPSSRRTRTATRLNVLSEPDQKQQSSSSSSVPYVVARGDGSTGGGGLPMPHRSSDDDEDVDDGLTRPKVGAEMPKGRPSWFKVPAPSQGVWLQFFAFGWNGRSNHSSKMNAPFLTVIHVFLLFALIILHKISLGLAIPTGQGVSGRFEAKYSLRRGTVSQYWRVLEWRHGNNHALGRHLVSRSSVMIYSL